MSNELARMAQMQDGLSKILARVNDYDVLDVVTSLLIYCLICRLIPRDVITGLS